MEVYFEKMDALESLFVVANETVETEKVLKSLIVVECYNDFENY